MEDNKKVAAIIVAGLKKKPDAGASGDAPMSTQDDSGAEEPDHMTAAREVMQSMKAGDVQGFADALKSFVKLCDYDDEGEGDEGEQEPAPKM